LKNPKYFAPKGVDVRIWRTLLVRTGQTPSPMTADVFYGRPLTESTMQRPSCLLLS